MSQEVTDDNWRTLSRTETGSDSWNWHAKLQWRRLRWGLRRFTVRAADRFNPASATDHGAPPGSVPESNKYRAFLADSKSSTSSWISDGFQAVVRTKIVTPFEAMASTSSDEPR